MFLHVSVILSIGGVVSQHALQQVSKGGGGIPACLAGFQAITQVGGVEGDLAREVSRPTPKGKLRGIWPGGSPGPHPRGKLRGILPGGVSRPTPKREVEGDLARGVSPGPHPGGVSRLTPGGGLSQHALRQTPSQTATAAGGTHPTGMHSCCHFYGIDSSY